MLTFVLWRQVAGALDMAGQSGLRGPPQLTPPRPVPAAMPRVLFFAWPPELAPFGTHRLALAEAPRLAPWPHDICS
jgi:hypothetical protein